jgi:hypothetical protein
VQAGRGAADLNVDLAFGDATGAARDMRGKVDAKAPPLDVRGRISVADLWLAGPDANAFAFGARALELELAGVVPAKDGGGSQAPEISFASAVVDSPYVKLTRNADGWSPKAATPAEPPEPVRAAPAVTLAVGNVRAQNGRLLIVDEVTTPNLVLDLATVDGWARELRLPAVGLGEFMLQGTDRRVGAVRLAGARYGSDLTAELSLPAVSLAAVAPYLQRAGLPYVFTAGTGAVQSHVSLAGDRWNADTTLTLLEPALGGDAAILERSIGMPPATAFAALHERHGDVSLQLPLGSPGWAGGRALNDMVASAVLEALARPRLAPLPEGPLHVAFAAGRAEPSPQAAPQLAAIAEILSARPNVSIELRAAISRADRRWLAEQALAAEQAGESDEPGGIRGWLRAFGFRDQRSRIRDALAARGAGEPGRLDPDDEEVLGALVAAAPPIADDRLASLAAARSMRVASLLADRYGVTASRVVVAEATAQEGAAATEVDARFVVRAQVAPW